MPRTGRRPTEDSRWAYRGQPGTPAGGRASPGAGAPAFHLHGAGLGHCHLRASPPREVLRQGEQLCCGGRGRWERGEVTLPPPPQTFWAGLGFLGDRGPGGLVLGVGVHAGLPGVLGHPRQGEEQESQAADEEEAEGRAGAGEGPGVIVYLIQTVSSLSTMRFTDCRVTSTETKMQRPGGRAGLRAPGAPRPASAGASVWASRWRPRRGRGGGMKRPRDRGPDREAAEVRPFVPSFLSTIL